MLNKSVRNILEIAIGVGLCLVLFTGCVSLMKDKYPSSIQHKDNLPVFQQEQDFSTKEFSPVVRLLYKDGKFVCSGVVISDEYVLTAGHCLDDDKGFLKTEPFTVQSIVNEANLVASTAGQPAALNSRADYGLVVGNFSKFTKMRILFDIRTPLVLVGPVGPAVTCGFPWGSQKAVCYPTMTKLLSTRIAQVMTDGVLYPGMSGGPVIDIETSVVLAVNSMMLQEGVIVVSPLIGLFDSFNIKVQ